jgi:REP element-mobilizing transposase RayT
MTPRIVYFARRALQVLPMPSTTDAPLAYLITFSCYGAWLHGDARGSVDRRHNEVGSVFLSEDLARRRAEQESLGETPYYLDPARRHLALEAILAIAEQRGWRVQAAHVRSNHVHVVVSADRTPERVMNDFKAFASERLNEAFPEERDRKRWVRHGCTRYLKSEESCHAAIRYVVEGQGEPMAVYQAGEPRDGESGEPRTK